MRKLCARWVLRLFIIDQKRISVTTSEQNLTYFNRNPDAYGLIHDDHAPSHTSNIEQAKKHELGFESLPHPPYSPDLPPSDYYLFQDLKRGCVPQEAVW